jgi:hypothetical protein
MFLFDRRPAAKAEARARGKVFFRPKTQKDFPNKTRDDYQAVVMSFLQWCRSTYGLNQLRQVDARADELTSQYFQERIAQGKSAWTLSKERPACGVFFSRAR